MVRRTVNGKEIQSVIAIIKEKLTDNIKAIFKRKP